MSVAACFASLWASSLAILVAEAQIGLSLGVILFSGFAIPLHRFHVALVAHHSRPVVTEEAGECIRTLLRASFAILEGWEAGKT